MRLSKIQYPGDYTIDVSYYGLDLKVTSSPQHISGNVKIDASVTASSIAAFFLDLRNALTVDSVWINGLATTYTHSSHKFNIDLDRTYNQGESFSVQVFYRGIPGTSVNGSFLFDTHGGGAPIIWSLSEPYGAPDWFPCKDTPEDKADSSDVWITVADNLIRVANKTYKYNQQWQWNTYLLLGKPLPYSTLPYFPRNNKLSKVRHIFSLWGK